MVFHFIGDTALAVYLTSDSTLGRDLTQRLSVYGRGYLLASGARLWGSHLDVCQ